MEQEAIKIQLQDINEAVHEVVFSGEIFDIELRQLKQYRETIKNSSTNRLKNLAEEKYTNRELRQMEYRLKNSGYLTVDANGYYITRIKEIIKKAKGEK